MWRAEDHLLLLESIRESRYGSALKPLVNWFNIAKESIEFFAKNPEWTKVLMRSIINRDKLDDEKTIVSLLDILSARFLHFLGQELNSSQVVHIDLLGNALATALLEDSTKSEKYKNDIRKKVIKEVNNVLNVLSSCTAIAECMSEYSFDNKNDTKMAIINAKLHKVSSFVELLSKDMKENPGSYSSQHNSAFEKIKLLGI